MTSDDTRIRGKVAAILSKRELVLNVGAEDGVQVGTRFVVLNSKGINVKDPDTGEIIGTVEVPKTVVKAVRIDGPHLSVARTYRTVKGQPGIFGNLAASSRLGSTTLYGTPDRAETLEIEPGSTLRAELSDEDSYVKVGDVILETSGDEYDDIG